MKKPVCIFLICLLSGIVSAQTMRGGHIIVSPSVNNPSIRKSERAQSRQTQNFTSQRRYSSAVNGRKAKAVRRQQAKSAPNGSGL